LVGDPETGITNSAVYLVKRKEILCAGPLHTFLGENQERMKGNLGNPMGVRGILKKRCSVNLA
jgi:hypothetical protein